jgi:predicted ATPase
VQSKAADSLSGLLQRWVQSKKVLLLLDNFEQVLDASSVVLELLGGCPDLKVLVTSREALYVTGEQQYRVPVLATVDPSHLPPIETLAGVPAIALFEERARAVKPDFALTEHNARSVASICTQLDGLPLAIELAAARIKLFSPQEIQSRLDSRLTLLTGGPRNLPPRQRTLRAAIDWSYNLLNGEEQTLLARLGVFTGGCSLEAAEAICVMPGDTASSSSIVSAPALSLDLHEGLGSLLDKNLLKREEGVEGESRFSMLELIHDYALERLRVSGEEEAIRGLHARYFLELAEASEDAMARGAKQLWLNKLEQEHNNIRGALRWLLNTGNAADATLALRLSGAMRNVWSARGHNREGRRWLEEASKAAVAAPAGVRAKALRAMGHLAQVEDDFTQAAKWLEESLSLYKEEGDIAGSLAVMGSLAFSMVLQGSLEQAIALGKEGLALHYDQELHREVARLLYAISGAALYMNDFVQVEDFATKGLELSRGQGDEESCAAFLNVLGLAAHYQGHYSRAQGFYDEGLSVAREVGFQGTRAHLCVNSASMALLQGDEERAVPLLREGLGIFARIGDRHGMIEGLEGVACLAGAIREQDRSARLFGAAEMQREVVKTYLPTFARTIYEHSHAASRSEIGEGAFAKAWIEGRAMSMEQAVDYAMESLNGSIPTLKR